MLFGNKLNPKQMNSTKPRTYDLRHLLSGYIENAMATIYIHKLPKQPLGNSVSSAMCSADYKTTRYHALI